MDSLRLVFDIAMYFSTWNNQTMDMEGEKSVFSEILLEYR
jgi:hypothetical protein